MDEISSKRLYINENRWQTGYSLLLFMSNYYYPERSRLGRLKRQLKAELSDMAKKKKFFDAFAKEEFTRFSGTPEQCCSSFGCGRLLTAQEKLFGGRCIHHSKI